MHGSLLANRKRREIFSAIFDKLNEDIMVTAFNSSLSALQAFGTRIQSTANNIANANTDGYKRTRVHLETAAPEGVKAQVERVNQEGPMVYKETNNGFELQELSNVDLSREFPQMILDVNGYKANLKTLQTADEMFASLLDLKA